MANREACCTFSSFGVRCYLYMPSSTGTPPEQSCQTQDGTGIQDRTTRGIKYDLANKKRRFKHGRNCMLLTYAVAIFGSLAILALVFASHYTRGTKDGICRRTWWEDYYENIMHCWKHLVPVNDIMRASDIVPIVAATVGIILAGWGMFAAFKVDKRRLLIGVSWTIKHHFVVLLRYKLCLLVPVEFM